MNATENKPKTLTETEAELVKALDAVATAAHAHHEEPDFESCPKPCCVQARAALALVR